MSLQSNVYFFYFVNLQILKDLRCQTFISFISSSDLLLTSRTKLLNLKILKIQFLLVDYYEFLMYGLIYIKDAFFLFLDFQSDLVIFLSSQLTFNFTNYIFFFKKIILSPCTHQVQPKTYMRLSCEFCQRSIFERFKASIIYFF